MDSSMLKNFKIPLRPPGDDDYEEEPITEGQITSPLETLPYPPQENNWGYAREQLPLPPGSSVEPKGMLKRKLSDNGDVLFFGRDNSYPAELNQLIYPLCCNVCNSNFNSPKSARMHYESKVHFKHISHWLLEWSTKTGQPLPKIPRTFQNGDVGPNAYHCAACDLGLTSLQHANQHYNGKKHRMVVAQRANPSGCGFYNAQGKWIRQNTNFTTNSRFGIGDDFVLSQLSTVLPPPPPPPPPPPIEPEIPNNAIVVSPHQELPSNSKNCIPHSSNPSKRGNKGVIRTCELCNITVTSDSQMELHLSGSKHAKKLKSLNQPPYAPPGDTILANVTATPSPKVTKETDVSMFRTPSGCYYCKTCNLTLSDEAQFLKHLESKKHTKQLQNK